MRLDGRREGQPRFAHDPSAHPRYGLGIRAQADPGEAVQSLLDLEIRTHRNLHRIIHRS
jgi:hypothetical protein